MNKPNLCAVMFGVVLCTMCNTAFAQTENTWKKKVARIIDMGPKEDDKAHHLKDAKLDTTILEMMITSIRAGRLLAYKAFDNDFTTRMSAEDLKGMTSPRIDTITITNPVDGTETVKIVHRDFNYDAVHKYRILEEWTFDPYTGKTDIQITGVAPIKEIYGDDGVFRGVQAMFWVHYNEIHSIIAKYDQYHPDNTIAIHIWNDYFLSEVKPEVQK